MFYFNRSKQKFSLAFTFLENKSKNNFSFGSTKSSSLIKKINFTHPNSNLDTFKFQKDLNSIQGKKRTWYCGSYFGCGFHEDGLKSAINVVKRFKI